MALKEYKCPNCGANIPLEEGKNDVKCPYCAAQFSVESDHAIADALIANTESVISDLKEVTKTLSESRGKEKPQKEDANDENKIFRKYKIKDIVFLAIMAACMLVTGAIMALVGNIPVFGIVQVCLGLQFSIFPVIGMMKVRKTGSLLFMSVCCGVVLVFMSTVMFVCILICAVITEVLTALIFRGYKKDGASVFAGIIFFPLTLPFLYIYYNFLYTVTDETGIAVSAFIGANPGVAIGMSVAVVAVCALGAAIGYIISRELRKSGVMKK